MRAEGIAVDGRRLPPVRRNHAPVEFAAPRIQRSCRASSRSPSTARRKIARPSAGTTSARTSKPAGEGRFHRQGRRRYRATPIIGSVVREFCPGNQILNYIEAIACTTAGRRDNKYKARIKILVKAEGQPSSPPMRSEYRDIVELDGAPPHHHPGRARPRDQPSLCAQPGIEDADATCPAGSDAGQRRFFSAGCSKTWRRTAAGHATVTLSFKRPGLCPRRR